MAEGITQYKERCLGRTPGPWGGAGEQSSWVPGKGSRSPAGFLGPQRAGPSLTCTGPGWDLQAETAAALLVGGEAVGPLEGAGEGWCGRQVSSPSWAALPSSPFPRHHTCPASRLTPSWAEASQAGADPGGHMDCSSQTSMSWSLTGSQSL